MRPSALLTHPNNPFTARLAHFAADAKRFTFRGDHHEPKKQSHACAHKGYGVV